MEKIKIETRFREKTGKETAKKIRRQGEVPAVVYGKDVNISVQLPQDSLRVLRTVHFSESTIIDMDIKGADKPMSFPVLIKDIQYHPLTEKIIHIDFMKVSLTEKIEVRVPLIFKGEPAAVKEGAVVEYIVREVEVEGLPLDIPHHIDVDISHLEIGHSLHVSDLKVDDKLKITTHLEDTVVTLTAKVEEEEAAPAEGEAPIGPEVIREKKEEKTDETTDKKAEKKAEKPEKSEKAEKPEKKG